MDESALPPLLGIIGNEIAGNPMQFAIERVLAAAGLDWRFLSFDVAPEKLGDAVRGIDALGFRGLAVAPSHAIEILGLLGRRTPGAECSRWVDVVVRDEEGHLVGHNLIGESLIESLGDDVVREGTAVVVGDAAKSLALTLLLVDRGLSRVVLRDSDPPPDQPAFTRSDLKDDEELATARILIRGTAPMKNLEPASFSEAQIDQLSPDCVVVDLATSASTSPMLRFAAGRGLRVVSAIDLMVMRASAAFQLWTEQQPDSALLREAFEEYLEI